MSFESSKTLGGIGAIVMFIGVIVMFTGIIPFFAFSIVIPLVGAILVLAGLYGLAGHFKDRSISSNALIAFIIAIIGVAIVTVLVWFVLLANFVDFLKILYPTWNGDLSSLPSATPDTNAFTNSITSGNVPASFLSFILDFAVIWIIIWIVAIVGTFFLRRSLKTVANKSTTGLFGTAGLLMLVGAFLGIIAIGYILVWIGALILAVAFFQLKPAPIEPAPSTAYQMPPPTTV